MFKYVFHILHKLWATHVNLVSFRIIMTTSQPHVSTCYRVAKRGAGGWVGVGVGRCIFAFLISTIAACVARLVTNSSSKPRTSCSAMTFMIMANDTHFILNSQAVKHWNIGNLRIINQTLSTWVFDINA